MKDCRSRHVNTVSLTTVLPVVVAEITIAFSYLLRDILDMN